MFHWIWFQAIGNALCATGFGESIAGLLSENEVPNPLIERSIAAFVIVMLTLINFAGVKWVIRLQFLLLGILVLGAMDFGIGSFTHTNEGKKCRVHFIFRFSSFLATKLPKSAVIFRQTVQLIFSFFVIYEKRKWDETVNNQKSNQILFTKNTTTIEQTRLVLIG